MTTQNFRGQSCTFVYIDPAATGTGDGSSPTNARTTTVACASGTANTVYVIRRNTTLTWNTGTNANNNVHVIGMPLSTDPLYAQMPTEVITAWGADSSTRPILAMDLTTGGYRFNGSGCSVGCFTMRNPGNAAIGTVPALWAGGASFLANSVRYVTNSYNLSTATAAHSQKISTWLIDAADCILDGVYVESPWDDTTTGGTSQVSQYAIDSTTNALRLTLRNVTVWYAGTRSPGVGSARGGIRSAASMSGYVVENVDIHYVANHSTSGPTMDYGLRFSNAASTTVNLVCRNLSFKWERAYTGGVSATAPSVAGCISILGFTGGIIDTITVDLSGEPGRHPGLEIASPNSTAPYLNQRARITNITVTKASSPVATENNTPYYGLRLNVDKAYVDTVTVSAPATYALISSTSNEYAGEWRNFTITGAVSINGAPSYMEVLSWTMPYVRTDAFVCSGASQNSYIYIGTATLSGTWTTESMFTMLAGVQFYVDSMNKAPNITFSTVTDDTAAVYVNNSNNVTGNWYAETRCYKAFASTVNRTGGASAAIKMDVKVSSTVPVYLAPYPLPGKNVSPGGTGMKTFTFYIAYKGYSTFDPAKCRFLIEAPSGSTGTNIVTWDSQAVGNWTTDSSTWNNDTGLTIMKCAMYIPVDRNENCKVRVVHNWYQLASYWYLDPKIVVS